MIAMILMIGMMGWGAISSIPCVLRTRPLRFAKGRRLCWYGLPGVAGFRFVGGGWYDPFVLRTFPPRASEIRPHCPLASGFRQNDGGLDDSGSE